MGSTAPGIRATTTRRGQVVNVQCRQEASQADRSCTRELQQRQDAPTVLLGRRWQGPVTGSNVHRLQEVLLAPNKHAAPRPEPAVRSQPGRPAAVPGGHKGAWAARDGADDGHPILRHRPEAGLLRSQLRTGQVAGQRCCSGLRTPLHQQLHPGSGS